MEKIIAKMRTVSHMLLQKGINKGNLSSYNLCSESRFLDIGSGFGKPVFHLAHQIGCDSQGIEVLPFRVDETQRLLERFRTTVGKDTKWANNITFTCANAANLERYTSNGRDCTHIYSYNKLMSLEDSHLIINALNRTDFRVLVWSYDYRTSCSFGLKDIVPLDKF